MLLEFDKPSRYQTGTSYKIYSIFLSKVNFHCIYIPSLSQYIYQPGNVTTVRSPPGNAGALAATWPFLYTCKQNAKQTDVLNSPEHKNTAKLAWLVSLTQRKNRENGHKRKHMLFLRHRFKVGWSLSFIHFQHKALSSWLKRCCFLYYWNNASVAYLYMWKINA